MKWFRDKDAEHIATLLAELANERARSAGLQETLNSLRLQGYTPRPTITGPANQVVGMRDMDEIGRQGAFNEAIDRMTEDFVKRGHERPLARSEAERIVKSMQVREEE